MQIDFAKNDLRPVQVDVVVATAVVVVIAVCQPISFGSVFWQVNMRFGKYFCMLCVECVCPLRILLFFYTLWNFAYSLIKSAFTLHMLTSLVKVISELSSNGKFFLPENLSHLTATLFFIF